MTLDAYTLEKILYYFLARYFDIKEFNVKIEEFISLYLTFVYTNMEATLRAVIKPEIDGDLVLKVKGTIQYGRLHFDAYKILQEFLPPSRYYQFKDGCIFIKNEYLKHICICNHHVELEF